MKTTLERLEPTKVKLHVEVEPERVSRAFDAAARHLAEGVTIPGFRKGKIPRRVLEARIGKGAIAQHALEDALRSYYAEAVKAEEIAVVAPPEIDVEHFTEEEGCAFAATVEIRPDFDVPDHEGIGVTFPDWEVADDEVADHLDNLRERFAELEEVDRPARRGDYVTIDLQIARGGEPIEGASAEDALYEVGTGGVTPELDRNLAGAVAGQTLTYVDTLPDDYPMHGGERAEFTVTVKDVREKRLPALDDDFAATASEFDTLVELEEEVRSNIRRRKLAAARRDLRSRVLEAYLARVDIPLPEAMVEAEVEGRLDEVRDQAERYGTDLEQLLEMRGTDLDSYTEEVRAQAREAVKATLVLEALANKLGLTVTSADLEGEIARHAARHGVEPAMVARALSEHGGIGAMMADVIRRKALDALVDAADVDGAPTESELEELEGTADEAAGTDAAAGEAAHDVAPHPPSLGEETDAEAGEESDQTPA